MVHALDEAVRCGSSKFVFAHDDDRRSLPTSRLENRGGHGTDDARAASGSTVMSALLILFVNTLSTVLYGSVFSRGYSSVAVDVL